MFYERCPNKQWHTLPEEEVVDSLATDWTLLRWSAVVWIGMVIWLAICVQL
jgi:hypothetical protein